MAPKSGEVPLTTNNRIFIKCDTCFSNRFWGNDAVPELPFENYWSRKTFDSFVFVLKTTSIFLKSVYLEIISNLLKIVVKYSVPCTQTPIVHISEPLVDIAFASKAAPSCTCLTSQC